MYSRNLWQQDSYTVFEIKYNGDKRLNMRTPLNELRKESVYTPLEVYDRIKENGLLNHIDSERIQTFKPYLKYSRNLTLFNNNENVTQFESWFKDRLGKITGEEIYSMQVYKVKISFQTDKINISDRPQLMFSK